MKVCCLTRLRFIKQKAELSEDNRIYHRHCSLMMVVLVVMVRLTVVAAMLSEEAAADVVLAIFSHVLDAE